MFRTRALLKARSKWKPPHVDFAILKQVRAVKESGLEQEEPIRVRTRSSVIIPDYVGYRFEVHNGLHYLPVFIRNPMVGHKFGEFSMTRKRPIHPMSKKERSAKSPNSQTPTSPTPSTSSSKS
eukprot:gb/GEZN01025209.1/.p1 GENE.gb/GEZN01025209.1/~~gb/GEZN01025209.1/.p1  ORF type:complete len:123 (-),score=2.09 gb/GEZN01025209.1/:92-460(-)